MTTGQILLLPGVGWPCRTRHPVANRKDIPLLSEDDFESSLDTVCEAAAGSIEGVFGPASLTWRVDREAAVFLGAGRALLLQLAHPWVAAAIAEHSRTFADPIARFHQTFNTVFTMVFGTRDQALAAARRLHRRHAAVTGILPWAAGRFAAGHHYRANEVSALRWVLLGKQIADGGVLKLIQQTLKAGYEDKGRRYETPRGTPQGGVVSPLLSNILLTPFDKEMRHKGYQLTRWADDWVVTCRTRAEAQSALAQATKILGKLGVTLNREKTRIVHIAQGFEFLGFKIGRGKGRLKLSRDRITSKLNRHNLYAIPTQKSLDRFKDQIRALTQRKTPLRMGELIKTINPIIRGWGNYYCRSQVRKRFHQLDGWIVRRLWSHRAKRWRNNCWKDYPTKRLLGEFKLVNLVSLIPSLRISRNHS